MTAPWNVDWLNANSQRNYPLSEEASGWDVTSSFEIPNDFLVDLVFNVPSAIEADPEKFHVYSLAVFTGGAVITLGYDGDPIAIASVAAVDHGQYQSYRLVGQGDDFFDATGVVTVGGLANLLLLPGGLYMFNVAGAGLEPATVRPAVRGVTSVTVVNGGDTSDPLYGDITLVAGRNCTFTVSESIGQIRWDCVPTDEDFAVDCGCQDPAANLPCIKQINNIPPDNSGNFTLEVNSCIELTPLSTGLRLIDVCSEPCCGCEELEVIRTDLAFAHETANGLRFAMESLRSSVSNLRDSVLASKLGVGDQCNP